MEHRNDVYYFIKLINNLKKASSGCWEWQGGINRDGYGNTIYKGTQTSAHRLMMFFTKINLEGLFVDHICKNRKCCNPEHLRLVTPTENTLGYTSENVTAKNLRKTHCKHGHPFSGENLFVDKVKEGQRPRRRCRECNRQKAARRRIKKGVKPTNQSISLEHFQQFLSSF